MSIKVLSSVSEIVLFGLMLVDAVVYAAVLFLIYIPIFPALYFIPSDVLHFVTRRFQQLWIKHLLGWTGFGKMSSMQVSLPTDLDDKAKALLYWRLKNMFVFTPEVHAELKAAAEAHPELGKDKKAIHEIIVANHQIYQDWIYLWSFMRELNGAGDLKIMLKRSLMNIPLFGWVREIQTCM